MQKQKKSSPALDRIVKAIRDRRDKAPHLKTVQEWHTDAHTDSGGGWHTDAWKG